MSPIDPAAIHQPLVRTNFFEGRILSAEDLQREQDYHRQARYLHNRALGFGIVEGLDVTAKGATITVSPGLAIDALGRELVLSRAVRVSVDDGAFAACRNPLVTIVWHESGADPTPSTDPDQVTFSTWVESPLVSIEATALPLPPALVLGRITRTKKKISIDLRNRDGFRLRVAPTRSK